MPTTLSILSRTQGNLTPKGETEAEYYARFASKEPTVRAASLFATLHLPRLIWRKAEVAKS